MKTIKFLSARKSTTIMSIILIVVSAFSLMTKGLNLGIDFTGGIQIEISFETAPNIENVRSNLASGGYDDAIVQNSGSSQDLMVRIPPRNGVDNKKIGEDVIGMLQASENSVTLKSSEYISAQVGEELTEQGGLAMIFALIMIMIYIVFRFQWKFSIGAVLALIHDVMITLGIFSFFQLTFDLSVLAAILAVVGYSLNDTIVIFDRIRENFRSMRTAQTLDILNSAITQTIKRTIITSSTTLLVLLSLYVFGGSSLEGFSIALIVGVLIGTYSSIFVASTSIFYLDISTTDLIPVKREEVDDGMP
ncbi:MAG: protein translocase subunit SecF [Pseudomonadota bacterium]|jgi:preprotein translocase subunit SecF|nr:protein translocase subunit SecF [Pseudomonadota bacterium]|tara:strand:- start:1261 stop:2175 length:915 start_codon:yes stop_codon:yes gene_type:complete